MRKNKNWTETVVTENISSQDGTTVETEDKNNCDVLSAIVLCALVLVLVAEAFSSEAQVLLSAENSVADPGSTASRRELVHWWIVIQWDEMRGDR